jgi:hypothetical protein
VCHHYEPKKCRSGFCPLRHEDDDPILFLGLPNALVLEKIWPKVNEQFSSLEGKSVKELHEVVNIIRGLRRLSLAWKRQVETTLIFSAYCVAHANMRQDPQVTAICPINKYNCCVKYIVHMHVFEDMPDFYFYLAY